MPAPPRPKLLLATTNPGKLREYRELLHGVPVEIVTLRRAGITQPVEETGATIRENAILKAKAYARMSRMLTLADDSGLEVDALGGEPGPQSARYGGPAATDQDRNRIVLERLAGVPDMWRHARFRCVVALATPDLRVTASEGVCEGVIAQAPRGKFGFGYDPIFYLPEIHKHMAELALHQKNRISHRGKALEGIRELVEGMLK